MRSQNASQGHGGCKIGEAELSTAIRDFHQNRRKFATYDAVKAPRFTRVLEFATTVRKSFALGGTMIAVKLIATRPKVGRERKRRKYERAGSNYGGRVDRDSVRRNPES